jgi:hypothetical protein
MLARAEMVPQRHKAADGSFHPVELRMRPACRGLVRAAGSTCKVAVRGGSGPACSANHDAMNCHKSITGARDLVDNQLIGEVVTMPYRVRWRRDLLDSPRCSHCGARTWPIRSSPTESGLEIRRFECPKCGQTDLYSFDPSGTPQLTLLANTHHPDTYPP